MGIAHRAARFYRVSKGPAHWNPRSDADPQMVGVAKGHAERALELAPNDPQALELRGTVRFFRWSYNLSPDPSAPTKLLTESEADFKAAVKAIGCKQPRGMD